MIRCGARPSTLGHVLARWVRPFPTAGIELGGGPDSLGVTGDQSGRRTLSLIGVTKVSPDHAARAWGSSDRACRRHDLGIARRAPSELDRLLCRCRTSVKRHDEGDPDRFTVSPGCVDSGHSPLAVRGERRDSRPASQSDGGVTAVVDFPGPLSLAKTMNRRRLYTPGISWPDSVVGPQGSPSDT